MASDATLANDNETGLAVDVHRQIGTFQLSVSVRLPSRGVSALFGPSGSGKTSLLRLIAGLDIPDDGHIQLADQVLTDTRRRIRRPPHRRGMGVVFQESRLFPHYSVRGNLRYGLRGDDSEVERIAEQLRLQNLLHRYPTTLSGGEARRVAIGRALLRRPAVLLLDEPLTGLDPANRRELLQHIRELVAALAIPVIYISHDAREIASVAEHIAILDRGTLVAAGALTDVLARVELTPHLGGFEAVSLLTGTIADHDPCYGLTELALPDGQRLTVPAIDQPPGTSVRVRIPIRDIAIAISEPAGTSYRNRLRATITEASSGPDDPSVIELRLSLGEQALRARLTWRSYDELGLRVGDDVVALIRTVAFDSEQP